MYSLINDPPRFLGLPFPELSVVNRYIIGISFSIVVAFLCKIFPFFLFFIDFVLEVDTM